MTTTKPPSNRRVALIAAAAILTAIPVGIIATRTTNVATGPTGPAPAVAKGYDTTSRTFDTPAQADTYAQTATDPLTDNPDDDGGDPPYDPALLDPPRTSGGNAGKVGEYGRQTRCLNNVNANAIQFLYVYDSDQRGGSDLSAQIDGIRASIYVANRYFYQQTGKANELRVVTNASCEPKIEAVPATLDAIKSSGSGRNLITGSGYNRQDRTYYSFQDQDAQGGKVCGTGDGTCTWTWRNDPKVPGWTVQVINKIGSDVTSTNYVAPRPTVTVPTNNPFNSGDYVYAVVTAWNARGVEQASRTIGLP